MRFEVVVAHHYRHPIEKVWTGLANAEAIDQWLMQTNRFAPEVGCQFEMSCANEEGHTDIYRCEVLEVDPPYRMRWSWILVSDNEGKGKTEVEFRLEPKGNGTELTIFHRGDRDLAMLERFKAGWPGKLDQLAQVLESTA